MAHVPEMMGKLLAFAAERRERPEEDLTSLLVLLEFDGAPLNDEEVLSILVNLVGGGVDTTTSLAAWSFKIMAEQPELRHQLIERPELYDTAADEFLRYTSVNQTLSRTVTKDVIVEGQTVRQNDRVLISWLAANHDEHEFDRADQLILDRSPNRSSRVRSRAPPLHRIASREDDVRGARAAACSTACPTTPSISTRSSSISAIHR